MNSVKTIDEVIVLLNAIIHECISTKSRAGYFASLYHKVTCRVRDGIANHEFEDGSRMERLDIMFASRFLQAYDLWKNEKEPTASWKICFEATKKSSPLVLQQLLLGINAHINLDLGIAAVETAKEAGQPLVNIHKDFNSINTILASLTYEVMNEINTVSPLLSLMGFHSSNNSILIQFTIGNARDGAWCFAEDLFPRAEKDYAGCISERDKTIKQLAEGIVRAKGLLRFTVWIIHLFEWKNPAKIIRVFHEHKKMFIRLKKQRG